MPDTKVEYPSTLQLDEGDLPAVKDWKVGKTYSVLLKVKQTHSQMGGDYPNDSDANKVHGRFNVVSAKEYKKAPVEKKINEKIY